MNKTDYLKDISEIKNLMTKSSLFISLSGVSGIMAGIYALIGAGYAYWLNSKNTETVLSIDSEVFYLIRLTLLTVLILSVSTTLLLTSRKAKKTNEKVWDTTSKKMLLNFLIPLIAGGIYILATHTKQEFAYTGALMLLFYGLALVNASKHTIYDWKNLGYVEISLGLLSAVFTNYAFWFWVIGFGVLHIIYGTIMYFKHEN